MQEEIGKNVPDKGTLVLTLNRPKKRNALSIFLMERLLDALEEAAAQRVLILRGEGPVFCAGLDLMEIQDLALAERSAELIAELFKKIYTLPCVTIAAVQGAAVAGGAGLVAACDFAVAERGARIGFPETRRGLVAAYVSVLLARQISMRDVKELLLLGELQEAERCYEQGLITKVVEPGKAFEEAIRLASLIKKGAPEATTLTKALLEQLIPSSFATSWEASRDFHLTGRQSEEAKEGARAFLEKRKPYWEEGR